MTALAWPVVALVVALILTWRLDAFSRRWSVGTELGARVDVLEATVATRATAAELAAVREKLTQIQARLGPPK